MKPLPILEANTFNTVGIIFKSCMCVCMYVCNRAQHVFQLASYTITNGLMTLPSEFTAANGCIPREDLQCRVVLAYLPLFFEI